MFKFSGSSYLTSALSYSSFVGGRNPITLRLGGFTYLGAGHGEKHRSAFLGRSSQASNAQSPQPNVGLENESEAGMLGLQEFEQQFAFKDLMIHLILQFTLHIAFRGVLHRCENPEIHR